MKSRCRIIIPLMLFIFIVVMACGCGQKTLSTGKNANVAVVENPSTPAQTTKESGKSENATKQENDTKAENNTVTAANDIKPAENVNDYQNQNNNFEETAPAQPQTQPQTEPETAPTYYVSITVDAGEFGGVQSSCTLSFGYQPTVYEALCNCGVGFDGSPYYIKSINGLAEKQHGAMSGWLYSVNGYTPMDTCGSYYLNSGDSVYWWYQAE